MEENNRIQETDWDSFYEKGLYIRWSSKQVGKMFTNYIKKYLKKKENITIAEMGGGDSTFYEFVADESTVSEFHNIDVNEVGLDRFTERTKDDERVRVHKQSVLEDMSGFAEKLQVDVTFSYGLIEHFDEEGTSKAVKAHFDILKPDGIAIISYPTPTWLYKFSRGFAELFKFWIYHDERPLELSEVRKTVDRNGTFLDKRMIWHVMATQQIVVAKKK